MTVIIFDKNFTVWIVATQGLNINIFMIRLWESRWLQVISKLFPNVQLTMVSDVKNNQMKVDMVLIHSLTIKDVARTNLKFFSEIYAFDSRIRDKWDNL